MSDASRDLWLERSRFNGMHLADISYGILLVLTIQCVHALTTKPYNAGHTRRRLLLAYILVTFILATIGLAGNAKYSQMIWIDGRDLPGGPERLIVNELDYWINRMVVASYLIMSWIMDILLLHRCFVIWNRQIAVVISMSLLFLAGIGMSILIMVDASKGAVFTDIVFQLAYLSISVSTNIIYTLLVAGRLLAIRREMAAALGPEHSKIYTSVAAMIVESAALYSVVGVIFIAAFALHSHVENLVFLSINHVQGIAQLLIILRVAQGRAFTQYSTTAHTSERVAFRSAPPANVRNDKYESFNLPSITSGDSRKNLASSTGMVSISSQEAGG